MWSLGVELNERALGQGTWPSASLDDESQF